MNIRNLFISIIFVLLVSCQSSVNLTMVPIFAHDMPASLQYYKDLGFNTAVFIDAEQNLWPELAKQAHQHGLYAIIMVKNASQSVIEGFFPVAKRDGIDGFWINTHATLTPTHVREIQKNWSKQTQRTTLLGLIFSEHHINQQQDPFQFINETTGSNGSFRSSVVYFNDLATNFFGQYFLLNLDSIDAQNTASQLVKYYNWRAAFGKESLLINPFLLALPQNYLNPELARAQITLTSSMNDALYVPISLYNQDLSPADTLLIKKLLTLRSQYPAMYKGKRENISYTSGVYIDLKTYGKQQLIIAVNFSNKATITRLTYLKKFKLQGKTLTQLLDNTTINLDPNNLSLSLKPYESSIWLVS
jgi:hypothetical protein